MISNLGLVMVQLRLVEHHDASSGDVSEQDDLQESLKTDDIMIFRDMYQRQVTIRKLQLP